MFYRMLAHNGEINTLRGNVNLMKAREGVMRSPYIEDMQSLYPVVEPNLSDSGSLDCVLEFIVMAGKRDLPEVFKRGLFCIYNPCIKTYPCLSETVGEQIKCLCKCYYYSFRKCITKVMPLNTL